MKDRLKECRAALKLTLQEVADAVGTSKSYIWELEQSNIKSPSAKKLEEIAKVLNTTSRYLLIGHLQFNEENVLHDVYLSLSQSNKELVADLTRCILKNQQENLKMPTNPIMQYFNYKHLPEHLQETSKQFALLAEWMNNNLPDNVEKSAGLRKLLEAKDCAVRAEITT